MDAPILRWLDSTPAVTQSWLVKRVANPECAAQAAHTTWTQVATLPGATLTFTDSTLPAGSTAVYVVQAVLKDGSTGPTSNQAVTCLRPAKATGLVATGSTTSIGLSWTNPAGTTAVDVYRDGLLLAHLGAVTTYTDSTGYGHSHTYAVVASNRWELLAMTGFQTGHTVPVGDALAKTYFTAASSDGRRLASGTTTAYTAPAAPTTGASATRAVPSTSTNSATVYWKPAGWTGSGTTPVATRDATWSTERHQSATSVWTAVWTKTARTTTSKVDTGRTWGDVVPTGSRPATPSAADRGRP
ncbi:MAG: hypothetical protein NVV66_16285 [Cellulomonas sp.]|uniref:hypothetical protein n=1 Tax=Cellulomonas sp. TaxID=40001 RepID=UPI002587C405|nr:hypothetical protein [Cellulomonas sp.]MCR6706176.1 hypothetical protein [Cellulomonas sp.]